MKKRDKIRLWRRTWEYLERQKGIAFNGRDNETFDWYSEGQSAFYHILRGEDWRDGSNIGG